MKMRRPLRAANKQSGQGMVEYSTITMLTLVAGGGVGLMTFGPAFMNALQIHLDNVYTVINIALP
jgi:hypothetical protein